MNNNAKIILAILIVLSMIMGGYETFIYIKDMEITRSLNYVWGFVYIILVALWVSEDSKSYPHIYRPFEFGYLVFIFYIAYLPYYLIKTRGFVKGIAYLVSLFILFNIAWLLQWPIYWAS
jgi:hypothetical protein